MSDMSSNTQCYFKVSEHHILCLLAYFHYSDVIKGAIAYQITSLTIVCSVIYSGASNLRVNGRCAGNSLVTGEFPVQMASNAESFLI